MDSPREASDYDSMDHLEVNRRFVDDFLAAADHHGCGLAAGRILDLGTGTAQIPIELVGRRNNVSVLAVDLAGSMLVLAQRNVESAGFASQIRPERVDAKDMPYADASFAAVISNSIVHHIPDPQRVLAEACRVLQPGGLLFVRDLLRPRDDRQVRWLVETYAAGANEHQRQLFEASLRASLSLPEIREVVATLSHHPDEVQQTSDRHWTWSACLAS
ncbi:MAG TPA: class I SAM-dependent methyltransferase [Pirellulales bacterium]|nr:class I SAM-dependent methyltransferase [Pirellulales bacterium]